MKKLLFGLIFLFLLTACIQETESKTINKEESEQVETEENEMKEKQEESDLKYELTLSGVTIADSKEKLVDQLGEPTSSSPLEDLQSEAAEEMIYEESLYFLLVEGGITGFVGSTDDTETTSGIKIGDSINKLLEVYPDYSILQLADTYYLYDKSYFLTFEAEEDEISQMGMFKKDTYFALLDMTLEDLLVDSEKFERPVVKEKNDQEVDETLLTEESDNEEVMVGSSQESNEKEDHIEEETVEPEKEPVQKDAEAEGEYDPDLEIRKLAEFSRTRQIGDPEQLIIDWMGEPSDRNSGYTIYDSPPIRFVARDGVVKVVSWGRSGNYETTRTNEGIARRSTLEETVQAYADYEKVFLYKEGLEFPSYLKVSYHEQVLLFELSRTDQDVQLIVLCAPEMLEDLYLKNTLFTNDSLEARPVDLSQF